MKTFAKLTATAGAGAAILVASSFLSSSVALAAPCAAGSVATYTTPGFSCSVGALTFSDFTVVTSAAGGAFVDVSSPNAFNPVSFSYNGHQEYGFELSYGAGALGAGLADVNVNYHVSSAPGAMVDAYMSLAGSASGLASVILDETLSNGGVLHLGAAGVDWITFPGVDSLFAVKDQSDIAIDGVAVSSSLIDAFSITTPEPGTMALFGAALFGSTLWLRRRRKS